MQPKKAATQLPGKTSGEFVALMPATISQPARDRAYTVYGFGRDNKKDAQQWRVWDSNVEDDLPGLKKNKNAL
jgi:hypothetical protein